MAERLQSLSPSQSPLGAFVRGAVALELAAAFPVIGWFFVIPLTMVTALGATVFALLHWTPGPPTRLPRRTRRSAGTAPGLSHARYPPHQPPRLSAPGWPGHRQRRRGRLRARSTPALGGQPSRPWRPPVGAARPGRLRRPQPADLRPARRRAPARLAEIGLAAWIEEQLAPAAIDDGPGRVAPAAVRDARHERRRPVRSQRQDSWMTWISATVPARAAPGHAAAAGVQPPPAIRSAWSSSGATTSTSASTRATAGSSRPSTTAKSIRPHALGRFRDLLWASAHSPAMLVYLDNQANVQGRAQRELRPRADGAAHARAWTAATPSAT